MGRGVTPKKRTVSGMVTDENDNPVSGATVIVQGTTTGTTTTAGKFTIQVTPASILEVKFLGYKTAEVKVGTQTNLTIKLETTSETIQDVVVTALGMTRERKSLGYSVGDIKGEAFEKVRELNVINSLAGREPGLIISQTAGGPSGSSHVEIRGSSMLTGNNQPLYVVDGMPIDNTNFGSANKDGGYDLGDGISSINPDDIENISVLKGPAASALYGSQAGNGVIMITTKKASSRKGQSLGVEINSTTTVEQQLTRFDDVQYIYGQGSNGRIYGTIDDRSNSSKSWGPKIDKNLKIWYFDNVLRPYTISNHGIEDFFRLGVTANNSITLNKIYKDAGIRLSYSDLRNRDIVPNSGMNRSTFTVRTNTKIGRKIDVDVKVNYVYEKVNNRPALAGDRNNEGKNLSSLPSTYDLYLLRDNYKDEEGKYYNWNGDVNRVNPYWIINEMSNTSKKEPSDLLGQHLIQDHRQAEIQALRRRRHHRVQFRGLRADLHAEPRIGLSEDPDQQQPHDQRGRGAHLQHQLGQKHESGRNGRIEPLPCGQLPDHDHGQGHGRTRNQENQQFLRQDDRRIALPETNQLGLRHGQSGV